MRARGLVAAVAAVTCVAGCTSDFDDEPPRSAPVVITADDASTMKDGRDYDVVATLPAKVDGRKAHYFGVSPDGLVFGETYAEDPKAKPSVGPGDMGVSARSNVILLDPESRKVTRVSDGDARARRTAVSGVDVDEKWVTWLEIEAIDGSDWTLYSYERSTGTERRLGTHRDAKWQDNSVGPGGAAGDRWRSRRAVDDRLRR